MPKEELNIVDDEDNVIGIEDRKVIHDKGLLHREVHVYFITPRNEIIFQRRAKDKDTYPGLLDATVGGHVEIGYSYEATAVKETLEETGLLMEAQELIPLAKLKRKFLDEATGKTNHAFQSEYACLFKGDAAQLKVEAGKATGFEVWPIERLPGLAESEKAQFIPYCYAFVTTTLLDYTRKIDRSQKDDTA